MAKTPIDEVLERLDGIIADSLSAPSRAGYFAALYRRVTATVRDNIGKGYFDDDDRMEKFDFLFASRYIEAYDQWKSGDPALSCSWKVAFDTIANPYALILHHLILGINAHINFDLGVAAAQTAPTPKELEALKNDFDKINQLLGSVVPGLLDELVIISPWIRVLEKLGRSEEIRLAGSVVGLAREFAWLLAKELVALDGHADARKILLAARDLEVSLVGKKIASPGLFFNIVNKIVWARESHDIRKNIEVLNTGATFRMA